MLRRILLLAAGFATLAIPLSSVAAQPSSQISGLHLTFVAPSDLAFQTDPIDVFVRLSLDAGAPPFNFDGTFYDPFSPMPFGISASLLPTTGTIAGTDIPADIAPGSYMAAFLVLGFECSGTFTSSCLDGPPYSFTFGPGITTATSLSMAPGTSIDLLFGTFTPDGGTAPTGLYTFFDAELLAQVNGQDAAGDIVIGYTNGLADTCDNQVQSCAFTRNVVAAPEPATFGLVGLGFGFLGFTRRKRTRA